MNWNWISFRLWEGNQEPAWTGAAARTAALENNWLNEESLGASIYWLGFTLNWAVEHHIYTTIIVMNQIQLEFMAALTVSLGGAHIRIENYVCAEWNLKVIKKIDWVLSTSVSPWCDKCAQKQYLVEPVCQFSKPLLCRTTTMLSYYALCCYVEPLASVCIHLCTSYP